MGELMNQITLFDAILGFFILIFAIKGLISGFIAEFSKIFGWAVGVIVAFRFRVEAGDILNKQFDLVGGQVASQIAGFIALLSIFLLLIYILNAILTSIAEKISGLGFLNKFLGFIFGGAKVFFIFAFILSILYSVPAFKIYLFDRFDMDKKEKFIFPLMIKTGTYLLNLKFIEDKKENMTKKIEEEIIK